VSKIVGLNAIFLNVFILIGSVFESSCRHLLQPGTCCSTGAGGTVTTEPCDVVGTLLRVKPQVLIVIGCLDAVIACNRQWNGGVGGIPGVLLRYSRLQAVRQTKYVANMDTRR
jgi:hypothetical protein